MFTMCCFQKCCKNIRTLRFIAKHYKYSSLRVWYSIMSCAMLHGSFFIRQLLFWSWWLNSFQVFKLKYTDLYISSWSGLKHLYFIAKYQFFVEEMNVNFTSGTLLWSKCRQKYLSFRRQVKVMRKKVPDAGSHGVEALMSLGGRSFHIGLSDKGRPERETEFGKSSP